VDLWVELGQVITPNVPVGGDTIDEYDTIPVCRSLIGIPFLQLPCKELTALSFNHLLL
jgi:hypothetical protein